MSTLRMSLVLTLLCLTQLLFVAAAPKPNEATVSLNVVSADNPKSPEPSEAVAGQPDTQEPAALPLDIDNAAVPQENVEKLESDLKPAEWFYRGYGRPYWGWGYGGYGGYRGYGGGWGGLGGWRGYGGWGNRGFGGYGGWGWGRGWW